MGRGNVCVTGPHEGLYYIDNDHVLCTAGMTRSPMSRRPG